jgi:peptidoglycan/LPS O-acetylase OafA/YrhL
MSAQREAPAANKHVPPLDGLRGVSVLAVLLYHAEAPWLPGGFLGVDVFFVLSGFLITALLCREQLAFGRIDLTGFYVRRIRRLMPALVTCLFGTLAYTWLFLPEERNPVALDALSALTYTTNAHLVLGARGYFEEALRPSLLKHLWSLAVEEQFYLLYPPLCIALFLRLPPRLAAGLSALLAVASGLRMDAVFDPLRDPSRAYYGTDSHAFGLLFGAALAFLGAHSTPTTTRSPLRAALATLSAGALLVAFVIVDESESYVFRGGIFAVSCAAAILVASIGRGAPLWLERALSVRPLVWVGELSYSLYLFHWPVCVLLGAAVRERVPPSLRIALIAGVSLAVAALSRRLIELPFLRSARRPATTPAASPERLALASGALLSVAAGVLLLWSDLVVRTPVPLVADASLLGAPSELPTLDNAAPVAPGLAPPPAPDQAEGSAQAEHLADLALDGPELSASAPHSAPSPANQAREHNAAPAGERSPAPVSAASFAEALLRRDCDRAFGLRPRLANSDADVLAVGDSVMLGAARSIWAKNPRIEIDACVGRNAVAASQMLVERVAAGPLPSTVIVHVGNNGGVNSAHLTAIMGSLKGAKRICFVTTRVPRRSQERTNGTLKRAGDEDPRVVVADWFTLAETDESLFRPDGVHLTPQGARAYAQLLVDTCL